MDASRIVSSAASMVSAPADVAMERYSRQVLFAPIGEAGQQRICRSHVAIVGCGATGAASAEMLVRAGVGCLTLIDRDIVEESNLQRQVLFDEQDSRDSLPKAEAARRKLSAINSRVQIKASIADVVPSNIDDLLHDCDLLLDATDNFETRYLLNDYAIANSKPWIYAGAVGGTAAGMTILPGRTACLACIFPSAPQGWVETCDTAGILNSVANIAASTQVTEALKLLTGNEAALRGTLLNWDLWSNRRAEFSSATPRTDCEVCAGRKFHHLAGTGRAHVTLCGRNSVQIHEHARAVDLTALQQRLAGLGEVRGNGLMVRFRPGSGSGQPTLHFFADGRALITGTTDAALARSLYARYLGS